MERIQIALCCEQDASGEVVRLDALDVPTALTIADINVPDGYAELWRDGHRTARLTKHGGRQGTFWEVSASAGTAFRK